MTAIGDNAFYNCRNITSVIIPDGVTTIGNAAFQNCSQITSVIIPDTVTTIGNAAFQNCSQITSVIIPDTVTTIGEYAFSSCTSLKSVTMPNTITVIGENAFAICSYLESINAADKSFNIPDSVTTIGYGAFQECNSVETINIPASVTTILDRAFYSCGSLNAINVAEDNPNYCSIDGVLFSSDKKTLLLYPIGKGLKEYRIPNGVETIGPQALNSCSKLESVVIPGSVTTISEYAFASSGLKSATIPDSVTSIGRGAFKDCPYLTTLNLGNSLQSIGTSAFARCSLTSIEIPDSVTRIGSQAFTGCSSLQHVTIWSKSIESFGYLLFQGCSNMTTISFYLESAVKPDFESLIDNQAFSGISSATATLYYPEGSTGWEKDTMVVGGINFTLKQGIYTVTFNSKGGSAIPAQTRGKDETVRQPADPVKEGRTFEGWYKDAECTEAWNFASDTVSSDITLYAKWDKYAVTFNSNGGGSVDSQTVAHGEKASRPDNPTKSGYSFAGWYSDSSLTTPFDFDSTVITDDVTLYARWARVYIPDLYTPPAPKQQTYSQKSVEVSGSYTEEDYDNLIAVYVDSNGQTHIIPNGYYDRETGHFVYTLNDDLKNVKVEIRRADEVVPPSVSESHWAYEAIKYFTQRGVVTELESFDPDKPMTRGEMVAYFARCVTGIDFSTYSGKSKFSDVSEDNPYLSFLNWAQSVGIISGYPDGTFKPDEEISREEVCAIFVNFLKYYKAAKFQDHQEIIFNDSDQISGWALENVADLVSKGLIKGLPDGEGVIFAPDKDITHAEILTILHRIMTA